MSNGGGSLAGGLFTLAILAGLAYHFTHHGHKRVHLRIHKSGKISMKPVKKSR